MKTNRLSEKMTAILNSQVTEEAFASQIYLSYASWASGEGYTGIAKFLFRHAEEERNHMTKILEYILNRGAKVSISAIAPPPKNPTDICDCFEKIFNHEVKNTTAIYAVVKKSMEEEDWATWNFMQWFVKEQTEEESFAMGLLDKIKIAGKDKASSNTLYLIDKDLEHTNGELTAAQDVTATKP